MGAKVRDGGTWHPFAIVEQVGTIEDVTDTITLDLNGGILSDVTVSESPDVSPQSATDGASLSLEPGKIGGISGGAAALGWAPSGRPTGTAIGDTLLLAFIVTQVGAPTAPTITGYTRLTGPDLAAAGSTDWFFLYQRTGGATVTAGDLATVSLATQGWSMVALRSVSTLSVAPDVGSQNTSATVFVSDAITTVAVNSLVIFLCMTDTNRTVNFTTSSSGAAAIFYGISSGVSYSFNWVVRWMTTTGSSGTATWTNTGTATIQYQTYVLALV